MNEEAKESFTNAAGEFGISDYAANVALSAIAGMDEYTDIAFESVSVTVAELTAEEITNMVATVMSHNAGQSPDPGGIEGVDWGDFEGGSVDQDGNFSYDTVGDFAKGLATSFATGWFGFPDTPAGDRGSGAGGGLGGPGGTGGVDADAFADALSTSLADMKGEAMDAAAAAAAGKGGTGFTSSDDYDDDFSGPDDGKGGKGGYDVSPGYDGGEGDAGDAGGDAGTYICTAAYANGVTDYKTFSANRKYGINLRRNDPYLMKGYDLVGPTYAKWFGSNNVGKTLTTYYKKSVMGEQLNWKYKLLEKFLLYINRPTLRVLGYLNERISSKG
jgi:hypothetical protein